MTRHKKYIVIRTKGNGLQYSEPSLKLRFGYPIYHKDLIHKNELQSDCLGGGYWEIKDDNIILYGSSDDFGAPKKQDLEEAIKNFCDWDHLEWICEHIYDKYIHLNRTIYVETRSNSNNQRS